MTGSRRVVLALLLVASSAVADPPRAPVDVGDPDAGFDWVQIDSGEWLRGELLRMQDETLYFDSEEFDDMELDWGDVVVLVSSGAHSFRIEGRDPIIGTFEMRSGRLRIDTGSEVIEVESDRILAVIPGEGSELDYWSFEASVGLTAQRGNTQQTDLSLFGEVRRESTLTRWVTDYRGNFRESEGSTTAESHRVPTKFDYFLTSRLFLNLATVEYFQDEFQNIDSRLTGGAGVGYELLDEKYLDVEAGIGAAYQRTSYVSVGPDEDKAEHDAAALFGIDVELDLPRDVEWDNSYVLQLVTTDLDKTSHHAESVLELDIWGPLDLEVAFIFDRIEKPRPDSDGERPKSNDYRLTVGLGLEY